MTTTLFIGLDGCTFTVLDQMVSDLPGEGVTMPFMKSLMARGVRAKLRSTPNPLTPPAWTSIMTGKGPGEHGVFDFIRAEDHGGEVFWTIYDAREQPCAHATGTFKYVKRRLPTGAASANPMRPPSTD